MVHGFLKKNGARLVAALSVTVLGSGAWLAAQAQDTYPSKPIELNVMFPAGSSADVVARLLADGMTRQLGQQVIVNNRPGAGGAIAYKYVQAQKPDGYTLVFNSNSISTVYYSGLTTFDYKAFDPVARATVENPVIAVKADAPWNNLKDLVGTLRSKPGQVRLGNSGIGSHTHITAVAFFGAQGVEPLHVPFGSSQVLTSLLGGHIDALVQLPSALAPHVRSGTVKILGVLASRRDPAFPNVPTAGEQGFDFQADMWRGIAAPRGTPPAVLARLEDAVQKTVSSPEFREQGEKNGFVPAFQPAREFGSTIAAEDAVLAKLMTKAGIKAK